MSTAMTPTVAADMAASGPSDDRSATGRPRRAEREDRAQGEDDEEEHRHEDRRWRSRPATTGAGWRGRSRPASPPRRERSPADDPQHPVAGGPRGGASGPAPDQPERPDEQDEGISQSSRKGATTWVIASGPRIVVGELGQRGRGAVSARVVRGRATPRERPPIPDAGGAPPRWRTVAVTSESWAIPSRRVEAEVSSPGWVVRSPRCEHPQPRLAVTVGERRDDEVGAVGHARRRPGRPGDRRQPPARPDERGRGRSRATAPTSTIETGHWARSPAESAGEKAA